MKIYKMKFLLPSKFYILVFFQLVLINTKILSQNSTDGLAPSVVFLLEDVKMKKDANIGSGFLIRTNDNVFLITAGHVARAIGMNYQIVMQGANGKGVIFTAENLKWIESDSADVALTLLTPNEANVRKMLIDSSIPFEFLSNRPLPPSRDIPITVMGYPLGLGTSGFVSPLSIETKAASGFITMPRFDNGKKATFILLQDPSIGGLSGGPIFDTGKSYFGEGRKVIVREGISVIGLIHGVIKDESGGKFAAIVPANEIEKLISKQK